MKSAMTKPQLGTVQHQPPQVEAAAAPGSSVAFVSPVGMQAQVLKKKISNRPRADWTLDPRKVSSPYEIPVNFVTSPFTGLADLRKVLAGSPQSTHSTALNAHVVTAELSFMDAKSRFNVMDRAYLMNGTIPQMQKALHVKSHELQALEIAVSQRGAGAAAVIGATQPIQEVIAQLGYCTTQGVESLCDIKELYDQVKSPKAPDFSDDVIDEIADPKDQAKPIDAKQVVTGLIKAIHQGRSLVEIIGNPSHHCDSIDAIRVVCDLKAERDWRIQQRHA
jgi:hypothetical protein